MWLMFGLIRLPALHSEFTVLGCEVSVYIPVQHTRAWNYHAEIFYLFYLLVKYAVKVTVSNSNWAINNSIDIIVSVSPLEVGRP